MDWKDPISNKRYSQYLYCSKKDAQKVLKAKNAELTLMKNGILKSDYKESTSISNALKIFINGKRTQIKPSTIKSYELAVNTMKSITGDIDLDAINRSHKHKIVRSMQETLDPTTINIRLRGIRAFFNYMIKETELLKEMPFYVKEVEDKDQKNNFIHPDHISKIFDATTYLLGTKKESIYSGIFFNDLWKIYLYTGIRRSEIYSLKVDGDFFHVLGKRDKYRIVPMQRDISSYLDTHQDMIKTIHPETIGRAFSKICKYLDYDYTIHSFRHTFACEMLSKYDGNIWKVSELLGHSNLSTTQNYLKSFPLDYLKAVFKQ